MQIVDILERRVVPIPAGALSGYASVGIDA
jgi:hypothetical protein